MRDVRTPSRMSSVRDTTLDLALGAHVSPAEVQAGSSRKALSEPSLPGLLEGDQLSVLATRVTTRP